MCGPGGGSTFAGMDDVEARLVEDDAAIRARRVAVLGMKTEAQAGQPAFYVAAALAADGVEIVPVPVYYPEVTQILGRPVVRRVVDAPGPLDIVCVFRSKQLDNFEALVNFLLLNVCTWPNCYKKSMCVKIVTKSQCKKTRGCT